MKRLRGGGQRDACLKAALDSCKKTGLAATYRVKFDDGTEGTAGLL